MNVVAGLGFATIIKADGRSGVAPKFNRCVEAEVAHLGVASATAMVVLVLDDAIIVGRKFNIAT